MTREELRVQLDQWFCGCGSPEDACEALLRLLRLHPLYEHSADLYAWLPNDGARFLLLYMLDRFDLTEHGGSVEGGWLTEKGEKMRDALAREEADGFVALTGDYCAHGFDIDDERHDCLAVPA